MKFLLLLFVGLALWWLWKNGFAKGRATMDRLEAAKVLGIAPDADPEAILAAHKRLIAKVHPDAGGSAELAARINQARDVLINSLTQ